MVKKLLWYRGYILFFFFFWTAVAFAQCPTSVSISASPADNFCQNSAITFDATPSEGTGTFIFKWELNGSEVGSNTSQYVLSTPTQGDQVRVTVISANGVTCSITKTFPTLSVNTVRTPTVSVTVNDNSVCLSDNVTFTATNTNGGSNPTYAWYINGSTTAAQTGTSAIFSTTALNEGNNTVTVEMTTSLSCVTVQTVSKESAVVNVIPDATITSPTNADQSVCINTSIQAISLTIGGAATGATVSGLPAGVTGALSGKVFTISGTPTVDGNFPYTISTTGNCKQTTATGSLTVTPNATLTLNSGNNTQSVCASQAIDPIIYSIGKQGTGATITGLPSDFISSYSNGIFTISGSSATFGDYPFTVTATGDCQGESLTGSITIIQNLQPSVTIVSSEADNRICAGTEVTFTAIPVNGGSNPSYQWKIGTSNVGTGGDTFITNKLSNEQVVTVVMTSSENCLTTNNVTSNNSITTIVDPLLTPSVTISSGVGNIICDGSSVTFTATPVNGGDSPSYQWQINGSNISETGSTFTTTNLTNNDQVRVILTSSETCLALPTATSEAITMTVNENLTPSVTITSNDTDNIICSGSPITFTAQPTNGGASPTYQWKIDGNPAGSGGATFQTSSLTNGQVVSVTLTSNATCLAATTAESNSIPVQIDSPISALTPEFDTTVSSHNPTAICPVAPGLIYTIKEIPGATSYIWTHPPGWTIINGADSRSITITATNSAQSGNITVRGKNECDESKVTSLPVAVDDFTYANAGSDVYICKGTTSIQLEGEAGGAIKNHKDYWWSDNGAGGEVPTGNGELTGTYTLPASIRDNGGTITLTITTVKPAGSICSSVTDEMTITVLKKATITTTDALSQEVCLNTPIDDIAISIGEAGTGASVTGLPAGVVGNFNNGVFSISGSPTEADTFEYTVNTEGACTGLQSSLSGTITVNPDPTVTDIEPITVCAGTTVPSVSFSGSVTGTTFTWTNSNPNVGLTPVKGTGALPSFIATNSSNAPVTSEITVTPEANDCTGTTKTFTITVNPTATFSTPADIEECNQISIPAISFGGSTVTGTTFKWENDNPVIGLPASGTGDISGFTALNDTNAPITANITVTPVANGCDGTEQTFKITVNPTPAVDKPSNLVVCNGESVSATPFSGSAVTGISYEWTTDNTTVGLGTASGTGSLPAFTATNNSNEPILANITVTPVANDCRGTSQTFSITVDPTTIATVPEKIEVCHGESVPEILFSASVPGTTYSWTNSNINIGSTVSANGNGNFPAFTASNESAVPITAIVTVTPIANDCPGAEKSFNIIVYPQPTVEVGEGQTICSNETASVSAALGGGATAGTWTTSGSGVFGDPDLAATTYTPSSNDINAGSVTLTFTTEDPTGPCGPAVDSFLLNINKAVVITTEPLNKTVCSTQDAIFEVIATGDIVSYEWYLNGNPIPDNNSATLVIDQATLADAGSYTVNIIGEESCGAVTSLPAILSVDENIVIEPFVGTLPAGQSQNGQPMGGSYCTGSDVTLSVNASANGAELHYQWMDPNDQPVGIDSPELVLTDVEPGHSGDYYVIITGPDSFTCGTATSATANITIGSPPVITTIGSEMEICSTESVNITTGVELVNDTSVLWTVPAANGIITNPTSLSDAIFTPATGFSGIAEVTLTVTGEEGCSESTATGTKTINVIPQPVITHFSYTATEFCESDIELKTPTLTGDHAFTGGTFSVEATPADAALSIDLEGKIDPSKSTPGTYTIIYSTPAGVVCGPVESAPVTVVIGEEPIADFKYNNNTFCKDTRDDSQNIDPVISLLNGATLGTFTYTGAGTLGLDSTTGQIDLSTSTPGVYMVTNTHDYKGEEEDGCDLVSFDYEITITGKPIPDFTYSQTEFCSDGVNPVAQFTDPAVAGTFSEKSGNAGLVFANSATGEINLAASTPGTYIVVNSIAASNGCDIVSAEQEITITEKPTATFSYSKEAYCFSEGMATVTYPEGYANDVTFYSEALADFLNEDTGEITWKPEDAATMVGTHSIGYTITGTGGCSDITGTIPMTIHAIPVGGTLSFGTLLGRVYTTCENPANIDVSLTLSGYTGTISHWEYRDDSTPPNWIQINSQNGSLSGDDLNEIVAYKSLIFRAVVVNGACTEPAYSFSAIIGVIPTNIEPAPVKVDPVVLCFGNEITLSSETGYGDSFGKFDGGAFTNAGIKNNGWDFSAGDYTFDRDNGVPGPWGGTQPKWKFITANLDDPNYNTYETWWNSHPNSEPNEHFAIVQGTYSSTMEPPVFDLTGIDEAIFTFDQAYNLTLDASITVEISTDGGETYKPENVLYHVEGPAKSGNEDHFSNGTPGKNQMQLDLGKYLGHTNLRLRFNYVGARSGDIWAVDNITVPDGPQGVQLIWYYDEDTSNPDNPLEQIGETNQEEVNFTPRKIGWNDFEVKTALLLDSNGEACESLENSKTIRVFVFDQYTTSVEIITGSCGDFSAQLNASISGDFQGPLPASETTIDGYKGEWEIIPPTPDATYTLKKQDENSILEPLFNPNVILESEDLGDFVVKWVLKPTATYPMDYEIVDLQGDIIENTSCPPVATEATLNIIHCTTLDFDGVNDYVDLGIGYTDGPYSIEAWIRPFERKKADSTYTDPTIGTIISGPNFEITMADLAGKVSTNDRWYHIAVSEGKLFVDGIPTGTTISATGGSRTLIGASWETEAPQVGSYFSGWIEEVRIWNTPLSQDEIRFMMNQRIKLVGAPISTTPVDGEIVPVKDVGSYLLLGGYNAWEEVEGDDLINEKVWYKRTWGNLVGYYRLISAEPDPKGYLSFDDSQKPAGGKTPNFADPGNHGRLHNMETHQQNTSPTPYVSYFDNTSDISLPWTDKNTWLRPDVWDYPNSISNGSTILWNIAKIRDNIHSGSNDIWMLGLLVESGELEIQNSTTADPHWKNIGQMLRVTHYLNLQGVIDLNGESQLLQNSGSIIDPSSTGSIEVDQQGTASSYNYNYWTSPVSPGFRHKDYNIKAVMKDGKTPIPVDLDFGNTYFYADGVASTPAKVSTYWLYKHHGDSYYYAQWHYVGATGAIGVGEGYSMKGTDGISEIDDRQNYTFKGLPNNGDFTLPLGANQGYLIGNPFPSALDARQFILDNLDKNLVAGATNSVNVFNGTLLFWSHFDGNSHYLEKYVGGYAPYNLSGGLKPYSADDRVDNTNEQGDLAPGDFIPIGQAFFVNTKLDSTMTFDGTIVGGPIQFKNSQRAYQKELDGSSVFLSQENNGKKNTENRQKIWLNFASPGGYYRQLLVTADPLTTNGFDIGYDAPLTQNNKEDMYWIFSNSKFLIQGVPNFNVDQEFPLGIKVETEDKFTITIDKLKNVPDDKPIYLKDSLLGVTHNLRKGPYEATAPAGVIDNRFKIVFRLQENPDPDEEVDLPDEEDEVAEENEDVEILTGIELMYLTNTREIVIRNPQLIGIQDMVLNNLLGQKIHEFFELPLQKEVKLPVRRLSSGVYVVKLRTDKGVLTEKIILE